MGGLAASTSHDSGSRCDVGSSRCPLRSAGGATAATRAQNYVGASQYARGTHIPLAGMLIYHLLTVTCTNCNTLHSGTRASRWPLKFRIRKPTRHPRRIRHRERDSHGHAHLLRHTRISERRAVLVARLVVALAVVTRGLLFAPAGGPADEVPTGLDRQRRHAGL